MGNGMNDKRAMAPKLDVGGIIDLGSQTVDGKVTKPDVFYVLSRATVKYDGNLKAPNFVPRIFESVKKNPF